MDKFMKALDFDSDTLGNVKRDMNFVLQRLIGNMMEIRKKMLRMRFWKMRKKLSMIMIMRIRRNF